MAVRLGDVRFRPSIVWSVIFTTILAPFFAGGVYGAPNSRSSAGHGAHSSHSNEHCAGEERAIALASTHGSSQPEAVRASSSESGEASSSNHNEPSSAHCLVTCYCAGLSSPGMAPFENLKLERRAPVPAPLLRLTLLRAPPAAQLFRPPIDTTLV
jgi:hypothetical protein